MKATTLLLIAFSLSLLVGCNKLTQKNIIGTWNCTAIKANGADVPLDSQSWVVTFNDDQTGISNVNNQPTNMVWSLNEDEQTITFPSLTGTSQVYKVLEKKGKTMRVEYVNNMSVTLEYTFEKQ